MGHDANFDKWVEQWEKAQKTDAFKVAPKPESRQKTSDFFGIGETKPFEKDSFSLNEVDAQYWNRVYKMSRHQGDDPDIFQELKTLPNIDDDPIASKSPLKKQRETPSKDDLGEKGEEIAAAAHPIHPSTRGDDSRAHVTGEFADGKKLREINDMKISLHALQGKLNANPKFGAYGKEAPQITKIQDQIDEIKEKIDNLSNSLSPDFVTDEES
jgi:hypothetical protein